MTKAKTFRGGLITLFSLSLVVTASTANADMTESLKATLTAAMADEQRPQKDKDRDRNRRPVQTLEFFGLEADQRVLELVPGGGWYTRLLAPAVKDNGKLYVAIGTDRVQNGLLTEPGFEAVEVVSVGGEFGRKEGARRYSLDNLSLDVREIDLALTFRNVHNFDAPSRAALNAAVFEAIKPGGHYGIIDHTRRHMDGDDSETWRRMDPVQVIKEALAAGFEFVDFSDLHFKPDDGLIYEVGRRSVSGNSDRFTLLFRKPE
ncbi:MAG: methyltransferase [Pseudomonadota bacterium]